MIRKKRSSLPGHVQVVFELPACVWADRISLTGDFNEWRENDIMLRQTRTGVWQATVDLPLGAKFQFRYVVDGQWITDSHADGMSDNTFGSQNSIIFADLPDSERIQETPGLIHESLPLHSFAKSSSSLVPRTRTATPPMPSIAA